MKRSSSIALWVISVVIMTIVFTYQRKTGPTYAVKGETEINGQLIRYELPRSHTTNYDSLVKIQTSLKTINGKIIFKRYKSYDVMDTLEMKKQADGLYAWFPDQPFAGKIEYKVVLTDSGNNEYPLTEDFIITRFKGKVPDGVLIIHITFMVLAMIFSFRTGLEAIFKGNKTYKLTQLTLIFLFLGGLVFGPIVQKFAFDAYWTGWPLGHDLTDNKTIVSFIFWLTAFFALRKNRNNRIWPVIAAIVLLAIYLIPHSMMGSEIDHTKTQTEQTTSK